MNKKVVTFPSLAYTISLIILIGFFVFSKHYISEGSIADIWFFHKGLVPYKDYSMFHLPLGRLPAYLLLLLSNWNFNLIPYLGIAIGIASLTLIAFFAKRYFDRTSSFISLLFFSMFYWYFATNTMYYHEMLIGLLFTICIFITYSQIGKNTLGNSALFSVGFLLSTIELSGQVASITYAAFVLILTYLLWRQSKNKQLLYKKIILLVLGLALPWIPFLLYFALHNGITDFIFYNFFYYSDYATTRQSLSILPFFTLLTFYSPLFLCVLLNGKTLTDKKNAIISILSLSTIPFVVFSVFHLHHLSYSLPILAICLGVNLTSVRKYFNKKIIGILFFYTLTLLFIVSKIIPWYLKTLNFPPNLSVVNQMQDQKTDSQVVNWLAKNTQPSDKIMVIGNPFIYIMSNRLPASWPCYNLPYAWVPFEKVKYKIFSKDTIYLITDKAFLVRLPRDYHRPDMLEFINTEIKNCYRSQAMFGDWEIWQRTCNSTFGLSRPQDK